MTIVNFMPAHKQAPVALWLLRNDVEAAARAVLASGAEAVLVPAGEPSALSNVPLTSALFMRTAPPRPRSSRARSPSRPAPRGRARTEAYRPPSS